MAYQCTKGSTMMCYIQSGPKKWYLCFNFAITSANLQKF